MRTGGVSERRIAWAADLAFLLLAAIGLAIEYGDGIRWRVAGVAITASGGGRAFALAAIVLAVRHAIVRRPTILARVPRLGAAAMRLWRRRAAHTHAIRLTAAITALALVAVDALGAHDRAIGPLALGTWLAVAALAATAVALSMRREAEASRAVDSTSSSDGELAWPASREWIGAAIVMALVTAAMLWQQTVSPASVPDRGDPLFSIWRLAWVAHQLPRDPLHLFDANIYHPAARTLAYSDAMLVPALAAAPALWAGVPAVVVYTALLMASFVAAGVAMYVLVLAVTGSRAAAAVAALVFAFDPYRLSHYSHLELQFACWMPLALLALLRALEAGRVRDALAAAMFVSLQAGSSLYYGAFLAASMAFVVVGWVWARGWPPRRTWTALGIGAAVAAVAAFALTAPYRANRSDVGERGESEARAFSASGRHYLTASRRSAVYRSSLFRREDDELQLFPGTAPVAAAALAFVPTIGPLSAMSAMAVVGLGASVDASFGWNGAVYPLLSRVPLFRGFRVPARFRAVAGLYLALLAGLGADRLLRRFRNRSAMLACAAALCAVIVIDLRPSIDLEPIWTHAPPIYAQVPDGAVLVDLPMPGDTDPVFVYFSTFHWHPLVNGSSGFEPRWYQSLLSATNAFPSDESLDAFKQLGTQYFVVHEGFYRMDFQRLAAAADAQPRLAFVSQASWEEGASRLYRLVR